MSHKGKKVSAYYPDGITKNAKRIAIFQCYDKDGIIDDYIPYLLNDLKENLDTLVIAVNGTLLPESREKLTKLTPHVFVRGDEGFDAGAWKEAMIDYLGWDKLAGYDELVLLNDTFFGPFYPFREVFDEMDKRPVDFWGLTAHGECSVHSDLCPYPYWPEHIQSYFIVIRKKMHTSYEFKQYWEKQPCYQTREELINKNEVVFTKYFEDKGFEWAVFVDTSDLDENQRTINHYTYNTYELIKNRHYPILKRFNLGLPYQDHLFHTNGSQTRKCLEYISSETVYDISLIYKNILRVYNITDIYNNLHLNYVLPKQYQSKNHDRKSRALFIFHISYVDMLDYLRPYICGLPDDVDVILTTKPERNCPVVYQYFHPFLGDRLRVLQARDPGRDLSALLVTAAPCFDGYDYIGFCHDKRSKKDVRVTIGAGFQECILDNTIGSSMYVENVLNLLDEHPELGLLCPPPPHHSEYFWLVGNRWTCCFDQTKNLANRLGLTVDIAPDKQPLAIGTAFWCRRDALAPLFQYPWTYQDFPPEPLAVDGTLNHALERIFPFVAQQQGYLTGWVMTDEYAALEINNIHYMLDEAVQDTAIAFQAFDAFENFIRGNRIGVKGALVIYIKKHLPKPFWGIARKVKHLLRW